MNGIHDMGGMHGFGSIVREENEPVFHHAWEGRVYAIRMVARVSIPRSFRHALESKNFRYAIERMNPAHYLALSYYERWLYAQTQELIEAGLLTQAELDDCLAYFRSHPGAAPPRRTDPELVQRVLAAAFAPASQRKATDIRPAFAIGDSVKARNMHPTGHTRLPRYVRGKRGVVAQYYGVQDFDDTMPAGIKAQPQPLYAVRFDAAELWGDSAEPNCALYIDLWESYLAPA